MGKKIGRNGMKIGDRVYVHGYIDEIRKDVVIIRNSGGYFGTVKSEIIVAETKAEQEKAE
jgi:hypothetical protein